MKIKVWTSTKASVYPGTGQGQEVERAGSGWLQHHIWKRQTPELSTERGQGIVSSEMNFTPTESTNIE